MKRLFRDNPLLALSIALPVLVVLLFPGATAVPRLLTDPPAHDLLLTVEVSGTARTASITLNLSVENQRVVARAVKHENHQHGYIPRIFRYDHENGSVREVSIPLPSGADSIEDGQIIEIPELANLRISPDLRAPDGYEYRGMGSRGGLMMELFGSSRGSRRITIAKNGAIVPLGMPETDYWYYGANFLGWVVGDGN